MHCHWSHTEIKTFLGRYQTMHHLSIIFAYLSRSWKRILHLMKSTWDQLETVLRLSLDALAMMIQLHYAPKKLFDNLRRSWETAKRKSVWCNYQIVWRTSRPAWQLLRNNLLALSWNDLETNFAVCVTSALQYAHKKLLDQPEAVMGNCQEEIS